MKIKFFLFTVAIITFISCNNSDEDSLQTENLSSSQTGTLNGTKDEDSVQTEILSLPQIEALNGTWAIKNISGGFAGINENFESGIITWTFNNQNSTLTVNNNSSKVGINSSYESGIYSFSIVKNNGNDYILIDNEEAGRLIISSNTLTINQNEFQSGSGADGFIVKFEK